MPRVAGYSPVISPFLARHLPIPRPSSPHSSPAFSPYLARILPIPRQPSPHSLARHVYLWATSSCPAKRGTSPLIDRDHATTYRGEVVMPRVAGYSPAYPVLAHHLPTATHVCCPWASTGDVVMPREARGTSLLVFAAVRAHAVFA